MTRVGAAGVSRLVMGWGIWGGEREGGGIGHHGELKRGTQGVDLWRKRGNLDEWVSEGGEEIGRGGRAVVRVTACGDWDWR